MTRWERFLRETASISIGVLVCTAYMEKSLRTEVCFTLLLVIHLLQRLWPKVST